MVTGKLSDGPPDITHWLLGAVGTLTTAIAALWKRNESRNAREITQLQKDRDELKADIEKRRDDFRQVKRKFDECEKKHAEQAKRLAVMEERMKHFDQGQVDQAERTQRIEDYQSDHDEHHEDNPNHD